MKLRSHRKLGLRHIAERKRLLQAEADIDRAALRLAVVPVVRLLRVVELGYVAARTGRQITRAIGK